MDDKFEFMLGEASADVFWSTVAKTFGDIIEYKKWYYHTLSSDQKNAYQEYKDYSINSFLCLLKIERLFDLGYIDKISIFIVTGIFAIIGNMGLYLLLKLKFNNLLSLTGSVLFSTFSLNLTWLANGSLDIPAVALSIWVVYFLFLALIIILVVLSPPNPSISFKSP